MMGSVLKMVCKAEDKAYIKSSGSDYEAAKVALISELRGGEYPNVDLQAAFNRYGSSGFFYKAMADGIANSQLAAVKTQAIASGAATDPTRGYNQAAEKPKPKPKPKPKAKKKNAKAVKK